MKKRARICIYIFLVCAVFVMGIFGYIILNKGNDNVMVGSRKFVTFREVPNAVSYSLTVKTNDSLDSNEHKVSYNIKKSALSADENIFEVLVQYEGNLIAKENYKQKIKLSYDDKIDCSITDYSVNFFDSEGEVFETRVFEDQDLIGVNKDIFCCVVSEYFDNENLFDKDDKYFLTIEAFDINGEKINSEDVEYDYYAFYENDFLRRENFFMNGNFYDYVIENGEELKQLVWNTILYRKNNVSFFVKSENINANNINRLVFSFIDEYPEYDALNDNSIFGIMFSHVGKLVNFDYYLDTDFVKNYKDLESVDKNKYEIALESLHQKDKGFVADYVKNGDYILDKTFEIDKRTDEVLVYNTEQLFMVAEYGAKPVFVENDGEKSVAQTVYDNARKVLEQINNTDNLTDYEKALNIYNYICNNVIYDYVTYQFMVLRNDFSILNFGNYSSFYLEGVFYDMENQYAVCDGLSKAFALMCNIEGIDCTKVNGEIVTQGNHAWNKVKLFANNDNENGLWYYVDTTWGVATYSEQVETEQGFVSTNYEVPTHTYFLFEQNDREREVSFETNTDEKSDAYDYYRNTFYILNNTKNDFCLESDEEIENLFDFAEKQLEPVLIGGGGKSSVVLEVEIDGEYKRTQDSKIAEFLYLNSKPASFTYTQDELNEKINNWFLDVGLNARYQCEWMFVDDVVIFRVFK